MTRSEIKDLILDEARNKVARLTRGDLERMGELSIKLIRDNTSLDIMSDYFAHKEELNDEDFICIDRINNTAIDDYNAPLGVSDIDDLIQLLVSDKSEIGSRYIYTSPIYFNFKSDITPGENCEYMPLAYYFDFKFKLEDLVNDFIDDDYSGTFEDYFKDQLNHYLSYRVTKITPFFSECIDRKAGRCKND